MFADFRYLAELHDLIHDDLSKIYPDLMQYVKITVYDIAPKILPMFDQALASYAMGTVQKQNIEIKTAHSIQRVRPDTHPTGGLKIKIKEYGDEEVGAGIVVWSTGLMQNPLIEKLMGKSLSAPLPVEGQEAPRELRLEKDGKTGGVIVDERFRARLADASALKKDNTTAANTNGDAPGGGAAAGLQTQILSDVFVIGDCAVIADQPMLPKTAQVASQEAAYLAKALNKGTLEEGKPFKFRNLGTMTYLGNVGVSPPPHTRSGEWWILPDMLTRGCTVEGPLPGELGGPDRIHGLGPVARSVSHKVYELEE